MILNIFCSDFGTWFLMNFAAGFRRGSTTYIHAGKSAQVDNLIFNSSAELAECLASKLMTGVIYFGGISLCRGSLRLDQNILFILNA